MIRIRPLAGAVLMTLLLTPVALASSNVQIIGPGSDPAPDKSAGSELGSPTGSSSPRRGATDATSSYLPPEVDARPGLQTMHFGTASLACKVASSSKDLVLINQGLETLPPGTRVKWQLTQDGKRGFFAIIGELGGGETLVADGVLDGEAGSDAACVARVI